MYATCAVLTFVYNGRERLAEVDKCREVRGRQLVVAWDVTANDGNGGYRSFYADKMENVRVS